MTTYLPARTAVTRPITGVLTVVVVIALLLGLRDDVTDSVELLLRLDPVWLPALLATQLASMAAPALVHHRLLVSRGVRVPRRSVQRIVYASNAISVTMPVLGPELATAYTFRQFRRCGAGSSVAAWTLLVSGVGSAVTLAGLTATGAAASGNSTAALVALGTTSLIVVPVVLGFRALRRPDGPDRVHRYVTSALSMLRRPPTAARPAIDFVRRLTEHRLTCRDVLAVAGLSVVNWVTDCLCLAVAVVAVGGDVHWVGVVLGFVAATGVGGLRLTPGGLGIVESAMTGALVVAGLPASTALAAVLLYRLVSFWLVVALGWLAFIGTASRAPAVPSSTGPAQPPRRSGGEVVAGLLQRVGINGERTRPTLDVPTVPAIDVVALPAGAPSADRTTAR